jgi:hypothetical protein
MTTPNYAELVDRARHSAPVIANLLDDLAARQATVVDTTEAWSELVALADDRRMGAKEASRVLGVKGPNLYQTLKGPTARRIFGKPVEPADPLAGGRTYRAREIEQLARALDAEDPGRRERLRGRERAGEVVPDAPEESTERG